MSSNKRIFYACQAVAITNQGDNALTSGDMVHGVQSVGVNTTFNLEQAFELGQIEIYENIEGTPDIEVTLEKLLDGYPLIYHMATQGPLAGLANSGLAGRSKEQCDLRLGIFSESSSNVASASSSDNSGNAEVEIYCSGLYVSSVSYTIPVDGNATESVTLVGNNKTWLTGTDVLLTTGVVTAFDGSNIPKAFGMAGSTSGGIQRREDVLLSGCIFPQSIKGVVGSGYGNGLNFANGDPRIHIQSFSCSTDFSREDVFELGRKTPYYRPASFPVEVSTEIEAITISGDFVSATERGDPALDGTIDSGNNTRAESIFMLLRCGYAFDLGSKNRLASLTYGGGDAGGGNVSVSYSYTNFNELDVQDWTKGGYIGFEALKNGNTGGYANDGGPGAFPTDLIG
jgi:hypothetical protein